MKFPNKKYLFIAFISILSVLAASLYLPQKSLALGLCSVVGNPSIQVSINGQTFTSSGSLNVAPNTQLNFTVYTYAEPSSSNSVNYPGGAFNYTAPSSEGRAYTTSAINNPSTIYVSLSQNCEADPNPISEVSLTISINIASSCAINSFTCDGNANLTWSTSNCSSRSISPIVGTIPATGNTQGTVGTTYTLTADGQTSLATCPAPVLTTTGGGSQTVTPGSTVNLPSFNFSNTGQKGSVIHYTGCEPSASGGGLTKDNVYINCPTPPLNLVAP